jgi:hypothetical protein
MLVVLPIMFPEHLVLTSSFIEYDLPSQFWVVIVAVTVQVSIPVIAKDMPDEHVGGEGLPPPPPPPPPPPDCVGLGISKLNAELKNDIIELNIGVKKLVMSWNEKA